MSSDVDDPPVFQHDDPIRFCEGRDAMGYDEGRRLMLPLAQ